MRAKLTEVLENELSNATTQDRCRVRRKIERLVASMAVAACKETRDLAYDDVATNAEIVDIVRAHIQDRQT